MTVFENVAFGLRAKKQTKELQKQVEEALNSVQLNGYGNRYPNQLSGGCEGRDLDIFCKDQLLTGSKIGVIIIK